MKILSVLFSSKNYYTVFSSFMLFYFLLFDPLRYYRTEYLFGIIGMVLSIPVLAMLKTTFVFIKNKMQNAALTN
jgi:hypothetical protein